MDKGFLTELQNRPLLLAADALGAIEQAAMEKDHAGVQSVLQGPGQRQQPAKPARTAVIPVVGVLGHRGGWLTYQGVVDQVRKMVESNRVDRIVLDIHSPGGTAAGAFEAAEELAELAQKKPVVALINEAALSGAYLLAAACTERVLPKSASVGSIGVVMTHVDVSKAAEKAGFKFTHLFRGKHKVDGSPYQPLTQQARAEFDKQLDQQHQQFTATVARMLGLSEKQVRDTEARIYNGEEAVSAGLADRVVQVRNMASDLAAVKPGQPAPSRVAAARAEGERAAMKRFQQIETACRFGGRPELAAKLFESGLSVERAREMLFDLLASEDEQIEIQTHVGNPRSSTTEAQKEAAMLETAVDGFNARAQGPGQNET